VVPSRDSNVADRRWGHIVVSPPEGIISFLDQLRGRHGSVERYATSIGVTDEHIAGLRAHLLD